MRNSRFSFYPVTSRTFHLRIPVSLWITGLFLAFAPSLLSQTRTIDKAHEAYKFKQYAEAARLYEEVLEEMELKGKSSANTLNIRTKLAYCYRMNNKLDKAEAIYENLVKDPNAKSETYLFYGETLMSNGKYNEAKTWFLNYQKLEPADKQAALLAANCDKIKDIQPYFPWLDIKEFEHNSEADDNAPVGYKNSIVFSSDRKQGVKLMKEKSPWTGRDYLDIYVCQIRQDGSFGVPGKFSPKLSAVNKNTGNASFARNGSEVYFTRNDNVLNKQNTYNLQLFRSAASGKNGWKKAEKLSFCSPNNSFMHPAISPDGQFLYFASDRKGQGGTDLWVAKRKGNDWTGVENLGEVINTPSNEGFPFVDKEGRLYFCSKGHPGYGGFDIFMTEKDADGNWKTPVNLGRPINSPLDDISIFLFDDGRSGMFTSSRLGGDDDIFLFEVLDEPPATPLAAKVEEKKSQQEQPAPKGKETDKHTVADQNAQQPATHPGNLNSHHPGNPVIQPAVAENLERQPENQANTAEHRPTSPNEPVKEIVVPNQEPEKLIEEPEKPSAENTTPPAFTQEKKVLQSPDPSARIKDPDAIPEKAPVTVKQEPTTPEKTNPEEVTEKRPIFFELPASARPEIETPSDPDAVVEKKSLPSDDKQKETGKTDPNVSTRELTGSSRLFRDFLEKADQRSLHQGEVYRLENARFDPGVWQLTPRVTRELDQLTAVLNRFPFLKIEIGAHTESSGPDDKNLIISQNRADAVKDYLVKEGINENRILGTGYGESLPLNDCVNGVTCTDDEHRINHRLEIKILNFE